MPCLILTGHPCAGKSTFARLLSERALSHPSKAIKSVVIVNEESARPDKTKRQCYESAVEEKMTRMALKAEFDRHCSSAAGSSGGGDKSKLVILDSTNYIKGYRYELHCISKAAGERHGVIWVLNDPEIAKRWNQLRRQQKNEKGKESKDTDDNGEFHTDKTMDELIMRYEPPDERNRWDKPLYTVNIRDTLSTASPTSAPVDEKEKGSSVATAEVTMKRTVYDMHSLSQTIVEGGETSGTGTSSEPNGGETIGATSKTSSSSAFRKKSSSGFRRAARPKKNQQTQQRKPRKQTAALTDSALAAMDSSSAAEEKIDYHGDNNDDAKSAVSARPATAVPTARTKMAQEEKEKKTIEGRIDDILESFLTDTRPLKEGLSTATHITAESNVLHEVDNITQRVTSAFISAQKTASIAPGVGGKITVPIENGQNRIVELTRVVHLPELRRLRRQYIKWITNHPPDDTTECGIASSFLSYIESQL